MNVKILGNLEFFLQLALVEDRLRADDAAWIGGISELHGQTVLRLFEKCKKCHSPFSSRKGSR